MKNKIIAILLLVAFCPLNALAADPSAGKPGAGIAAAATVSAKVEDINYDTREVTLKPSSGAVMKLKVGEVAHNFNKIKKGDTVTFRYVEAVAIDVQKADGNLGATAKMELERAPLGAQPKGKISQTVTVKALVEAIDYDKRQVTLKGPEGNTIALKVAEEVKRLNEVKTGDQVVVSYTEALGIEVTPQS